MSFYNHTILPRLIRRACAVGPIQRQRAKIVPLAAGKVLEVGAGGGLNLDHYDPGRVASLIGLDPNPTLLESAASKADANSIPFEPMLAGAEEIPLPSGSMDTVVMTYTLCSISDPQAALREIRRVLSSNGQLVFCEHGSAPDAGVRRVQRMLTPLWKRFGGNCHLDRDILGELKQAGFRTGWSDSMYLPRMWRFAGFNRWGMALPG